LLHLVGSSVLLYLIDDARSNTNQEFTLFGPTDYVHYTRQWTKFAVHIAASSFLKPEGNLNNI